MRRNGDRGKVGGDREILDRGYGFHRTGDRWLPDRWLGMPGSSTPPPQIPETITGLKGWWKGDSMALTEGAVVTTWPDSSGNLKNGTAVGSPQWFSNVATARIKLRRALMVLVTTGAISQKEANEMMALDEKEASIKGATLNKPVIYMNNAWFTIPVISGVSPWTIFAVWRPQYYYNNLFTLSGAGPSGSNLRGPHWYSNFVCYVGPRGAVYGASLTQEYGNEFHIFTANSNTAVYVDGNIKPVALAFGTDGQGDWTHIGVNATNLGEFTQGFLAELILYNTIVSDADRMTVDKYLGDKYGLPAPPPGAYAGAAVLDQSYTVSTTNDAMGTGIRQGIASSFTSTGGKLHHSIFDTYLQGSSAGPAYSKLYAFSGGNAGALIATSDPLDVGPLTHNTPISLQFNFSGANQVFLNAGVDYVISFEYNGVLQVLGYLDQSLSNAAGVGFTHYGAAWAPAGLDIPFKVFVVKP